MPRYQKAERTGGIYANRSEYFKKGKDPGLYADKGSAHYQGGEELADGYSRVAHQDAPEPVAFTQSRTARKGGGFDLGPKEYIYKKVEEKEAPAPAQEAAPEPEATKPEEETTPVEHSDEIAQAIERTNKWKDSIDGTAGSFFNTSSPAETSEPDAMPNSVSFTPAKIDTPTYNPNAGNAEQAQSFADKFKLNLLNKGAGQSDFSGV